MRDSFVELIRIEPVVRAAKGRYFATFQARTPEGEFEVTIQFFAAKEADVFAIARHHLRRMLARLAGVTSDWSVTLPPESIELPETQSDKPRELAPRVPPRRDKAV
jgi:hypothetical protein